MNKLIISFSVVLFLIGLLIMTGTEGNTSTDKNISTTYTVKFHISGCDACTSTS